jgi:hypothetical protein
MAAGTAYAAFISYSRAGDPLVLDVDPERWAARACALAASCGPTPDGDASAARG